MVALDPRLGGGFDQYQQDDGLPTPCDVSLESTIILAMLKHRLIRVNSHSDVIAGGIIGILVAWYCYRQYYPVSNQARRTSTPAGD